MKKKNIFLLTTVLILLLSGCQSTETSNNSETAEVTDYKSQAEVATEIIASFPEFTPEDTTRTENGTRAPEIIPV